LRLTSTPGGNGVSHNRLLQNAKRPPPKTGEDKSERAVRTERLRPAPEVQDEIARYLSAIHINAAGIRNRGDASVRKSAEAIIEVTGQIKELVGGDLQPLRPAVFEDRGLTPALRKLVSFFQRRNPHVVCSLSTSGQLRDVDAEMGAAVYHIVQECLRNIANHAKAHFVVVEVALFSADPGVAIPVGTSVPPAMLRVTVSDDGVGFHVSAATQGFGLAGIRERITALCGTYDIDTQPGRGTSISVEVPLPATLKLA
jgi:two-component system, NarL family, sensor histidine kinase UhpB